VNVTDTTVELTGTAATSKDKQTAKRIAQSYAGNRRLVDHITVGSTTR
jgi:osmotically-inducible protein OsmY